LIVVVTIYILNNILQTVQLTNSTNRWIPAV